MPRKTKSPMTVPQTDDLWYCAIRKLRTWIPVDEVLEEYARPSVFILVDMKTGMLLAMEVLIESFTPDEMSKKLVDVMLKPQKQFGFEPHRPAEIHFEDEKMAEAVQPLLETALVKSLYRPQRETMDKLIEEIEKSMPGAEEEDEFPGLLKQRGVKPELVGSLFAAALKFYREEPWVQLTNNDLLSVQVSPQKEPYYVIVMGNGGEEYGLSVFRNWQEIETFFSAAHPLEAVPRGGRHAFMYNEPPYVSFDDLDAIETYGWELPAPDLVPTPAIYMVDRVKRPDAAMLRWYEATLQAIPDFVAQALKTNPDGTHPDAEMDLEVQTSAGKKQIHIRYPGGDISALENRIASRMDLFDDEDELEDEDLLDFPILDRRGMEGMLAKVSAEMGAVSPVSDPALDKAQQIMYDAWEARSPKQRIALAKKALKTSPDCADAYVLLAEEEAETTEQKIELYREGVEAGRRALGEDFINAPENIGHFWGILETRPFMRALGGLAVTLWEEGQRDEAEKLFRELLRLNPGDNQGIRYLLLGQLMEQGQDEAARTLLKAYEGDWSADWAYTTALLAYKEKGDSAEAKLALQQALKVNQHVPKYLTGKKKLPSYELDMITMGGDDEAVYYARGHLNDWRKTPGAVEWLRDNIKA